MRLIECNTSHSLDIMNILNEAIQNSTALYDYKPRTPEMMEAWFRAKTAGNYPVLGIIDADSKLLGFGSYGPFRAWPAYKYTMEHSIYVVPNKQRSGHGTHLLNALVLKAHEQQYHSLIGGIDATNTASISLHQKLGFKFCGRIRDAGFKFGRWLDLDFYQLILDTPANPVDG